MSTLRCSPVTAAVHRRRPPLGRTAIASASRGHSTGSGRATTRSRSSGDMCVAERHVEGTASTGPVTDQPGWRLKSPAFQAGHAGSIPVTRSTAMSRDTLCPARESRRADAHARSWSRWTRPSRLSRRRLPASAPRQQLLPGVVLGPTVEPLVDRVPLPEPLRHVPPRRPGAALPRHAFYSEPVIRPRPRPPGHRRHQRFHHGPHIVRDLLPRHLQDSPSRKRELPMDTA